MNRNYKGWRCAAVRPTIAIVTRQEFEYFVPLLTEHLDAVVEALERQALKTRRSLKAPRRLLIDTYLATRSVPATTERCGVSRRVWRTARAEHVTDGPAA